MVFWDQELSKEMPGQRRNDQNQYGSQSAGSYGMHDIDYYN
jgi:hypothetical protein